MLGSEVVKRIDGKRHRIAKLKDKEILVNVNARRFPKTALKRMIAHETTRAVTKSTQSNFGVPAVPKINGN
jgi:hypothetical protein